MGEWTSQTQDQENGSKNTLDSLSINQKITMFGSAENLLLPPQVHPYSFQAECVFFLQFFGDISLTVHFQLGNDWRRSQMLHRIFDSKSLGLRLLVAVRKFFKSNVRSNRTFVIIVLEF